ncbi:unnamed protein product [Danaus chrysippus]|uniref:(African queen) hypothetical protein n=1 Tax=Danaus chrysippus TaxID=151541 RepID=A0A8J2RJF4_9NEOP|nr:unnamed protein product [Danaus chrysippus]
MAGVGAGFFSNPFGRLLRLGCNCKESSWQRDNMPSIIRTYQHAMYTIVKHDGMSALQKGFGTGVVVPVSCQWHETGYIPTGQINYGLLRDDQNNTLFLKTVCSLVLWVAGCLVAWWGVPLQLVKTQLMSYSSRKIAVGKTQHGHPGTLKAFKRYIQGEGNGFLWFMERGSRHDDQKLNRVRVANSVFCCGGKSGMDNNGDVFPAVKSILSSFVASKHRRAVLKTIVIDADGRHYDATLQPSHWTGVRPWACTTTGYSGLRAQNKKKNNAYGGAARVLQGHGGGPFIPAARPHHTVLLLVFWDMLKDLQKTMNMYI